MTVHHFARPARRGVILLVVLALLTLFAVVGLSFVLHANGQAEAARFQRQAESAPPANHVSEPLLAFFLGQLLYDVPDDVTGVYSGLRGHSLARSMFGYDDASTNDVPFNGTGRLHQDSVFTTLRLPNTPPVARDDYYLINYTHFRDDAQVPTGQRFLRDPERHGARGGLSAARGRFRGGFNASYTYPDLNNLYLAAVQADGTVLLPSYHRPWLFGSNDPKQNSNWTNAAGKYLLLRPRPIDMGPGFPYPEDEGGDVKNLIGAPGGNDSYWLDLDAPVLRTADGRKYKALFAPLVVDLDNRVNVNVHGNIRGAGQAHRSNQGWGPWEVNLSRVLNQGDEARQLFAGTATPPHVGRYGAGGPGLPPVNVAAFDGTPPFYARVDYDGGNEADGSPTSPLRQLPGYGWPATACFPAFPAGFGNGSLRERTDHPAVYNVNTPTGDDRAFADSNLEALLRFGDTGSPALTSELFRLCPRSFGGAAADRMESARRRRLVTTRSFDVDRPAVTPWVWNPRTHPYTLRSGTHPQGSAIPFPAVSQTGEPPAGSEFGADWRARTAALGRVNLNRPLPAYPPPDPATGLMDQAAFQSAQAARVRLAQDVFDRLRAATGAAETAANPEEYDALRWLAQLAVNIVDYVDADDVLTPFFWDAAHPTEVVVGTELPRVVLNEVYAEYTRLPGEPPRFTVRVWAELHNPLSFDPALSDNGAAVLATANQSNYQLMLTRPDPGLRRRNNVLGEPDPAGVHQTTPFPPVTAVPPGGPTRDAGPSGFVVAGPGPFPDAATATDLVLPQLTYPDTVADAAGRPTAPTLLLRRLACPYRPHSSTPGPDYNPFVTVDYLEPHRALGQVLQNASDPPARRRAFGRAQPYAASALQLRAQQGQSTPLQHTFGRLNEPARTPFDWLVHCDRPLISPMELLHVSAFKPHELTQEFQYDLLTRTFRHVVPWLDSSRRLYRAFEYLETLPRVAGMPVAPGGRVPGKININTIWDPETLLALCDPQLSNNFTTRDIHDPNELDTVYARLLATRSPGLFEGTGLGPNDRPFLGLSVGTPPPGEDRGPHGQGLQVTLLRTHEGRPLFQPARLDGPNHHPYLRQQLLTKVFNHLTTRSHVFAVWLTVGYFEVTDDATRPVKLGAELGRAENRHSRHRMFAIVDRSVLTHHPGPQPRFDPRGDSSAVPYFSIID